LPCLLNVNRALRNVMVSIRTAAKSSSKGDLRNRTYNRLPC
jgi:hypothetical protein